MGSILEEKTASTTESASSDPKQSTAETTTGMTYYPSCQSAFKPPHIANGNAFLGDVFTTRGPDAEVAPITCGLYRLEAGPPLVYTYTYHEMKVVLEGEFTISDEAGQRVEARAGDVFYFPKGATITFETGSYGLAFYTGQRKEGTA